jgi:hypothetical protein
MIKLYGSIPTSRLIWTDNNIIINIKKRTINIKF